MNGLAEHSSVCFIGNPFSFYFSTRCTAFTAAGASESRPCASTRIKPEIDGLRLVGGNPDSLTCPGTPTTTHASTTDSSLLVSTRSRGIAPDPPKTRIDYSWVQEERERLGGRAS